MKGSKLQRAGQAFGMDIFIDPELPPGVLRLVGGTIEKPQKVSVIGLDELSAKPGVTPNGAHEMSANNHLHRSAD